MGIKLVHESLEPKTEPEIFQSALEFLQNLRDNKCVGFVVVAMMDIGDEIQVEWMRHIGDDEEPKLMLDGVVAVGQEILEDYELDDYQPWEYFEQ